MKEIGPSEVDVNSIDLWVVSHGGVASNAICDFLEINGIRTRPENYGLICHKKHPGKGVNVPILVIYGDFEFAIKSMNRRKYLTANATKMRYGMDIPEINLKRLIETKPEDPLGIIDLLNSYMIAKEEEIDKIEFLQYPYKIKDAEEKLKKLGFEVDFNDFSLRERKKKFGLISKEVKYLLDIYGELNFP